MDIQYKCTGFKTKIIKLCAVSSPCLAYWSLMTIWRLTLWLHEKVSVELVANVLVVPYEYLVVVVHTYIHTCLHLAVWSSGPNEAGPLQLNCK